MDTLKKICLFSKFFLKFFNLFTVFFHIILPFMTIITVCCTSPIRSNIFANFGMSLFTILEVAAFIFTNYINMCTSTLVTILTMSYIRNSPQNRVTVFLNLNILNIVMFIVIVSWLIWKYNKLILLQKA